MERFWKLLSKALRLIGVVSYMGLFCTQLSLIFHWREVRPYSPRPDLGWVVKLPWCVGAYGTAHEAHLLNALFRWLIVPFLMVAASYAIDYYKFDIWPIRNGPKIE